MEPTYILFKIEGLHFLIPLNAVIAVEAGGGAKKSPKEVCDFGYLCGLRKQRKETEYILLLKAGTEEFRIYADLVIGIRKIEEDRTKPLKPPLIGEKNKYLKKAAFLEESEPSIAYVLAQRSGRRKRVG